MRARARHTHTPHISFVCVMCPPSHSLVCFKRGVHSRTLRRPPGAGGAYPLPVVLITALRHLTYISRRARIPLAPLGLAGSRLAVFGEEFRFRD